MAASLSCAAAQQLVRDIEQSAAVPPSAPHGFVTTTMFVGFTATTPDAGAEPWATDGTAAGTFRLMDVVPGLAASDPAMVCEHQGELLFTATVQSSKRLFRTDGTIAGTALVDDLGIEIVSVRKLGNGTLLVNSNLGTYATDLTVAGTVQLPGMLRFTEGVSTGGISYGWCQRATSVWELWRTDGTPGGTARITTLQSNQAPTAFTAWNGRVYLVEGSVFGSTWIASTNGTDFVHHAGLPISAGTVDRMHVHNNSLLFDRGGQIFTSDLTQAGTVALALPCADARNLITYGGSYYFRATTAANGYELWQTDGTAAGTSQVVDLMPGSAGAHPEHLLPTSNGLYFRALLPSGRRLMRLDTPTAIVDLGAIPNDAPTTPPAASSSSGFVAFQGKLLFAGTDAVGTELWSYDGSQPPARFKDLVTGGPGLVIPASTDQPPAVGETQFFLAYEAGTGFELYRTNGTAAGTQVLDLHPGPASTILPLQGTFVRHGHRIAFIGVQRVAITDGTVAGTHDLIQPAGSSYDSAMRIVDDELWFLRNGVLYRSNGTAAGTSPIQLPFVSTPVDFLPLDNRILLASYASVASSDGVHYPEYLFQIGNTLRMHRVAANRAIIVSDTGIGATDGTVAGSTMLTSTSAMAALGAVRDGVLHQIGYQTYWTTDGTLAGTTSHALPIDMAPSQLIVTPLHVWLVGSTPATGRELWRFDASSGQFVLVRDFAPGPRSGVLEAAALGTGNQLLVTAFDEPTGVEPWITNGTASGTHLLADVNPGRGNSNPQLLGVAGATAYLFADDGVHGRELMSFPLGITGAASLQTYGQGCLGSAGVPHLTATQVPAPGTTLALHLATVPDLTVCAVGFSTQLGMQALGACELLLGGPIATVVRTATLAGTADFPLALPNATQLVGLRLAAQGFAIDGLAPGGFTASDGLIFVPGF